MGPRLREGLPGGHRPVAEVTSLLGPRPGAVTEPAATLRLAVAPGVLGPP